MGQQFKVSETDIKSFIVVTGWIFILGLVTLIALGLIVPVSGSLSEVVANAAIEALKWILSMAFGAWLFKKAQSNERTS